MEAGSGQTEMASLQVSGLCLRKTCLDVAHTSADILVLIIARSTTVSTTIGSRILNYLYHCLLQRNIDTIYFHKTKMMIINGVVSKLFETKNF